MIVIETVRRAPKPLRLSRTYHREGNIWLPDYEAPEGHILVPWLTLELWRTENRQVQMEAFSGGAGRGWFRIALGGGIVYTIFSASMDVGGKE